MFLDNESDKECFFSISDIFEFVYCPLMSFAFNFAHGDGIDVWLTGLPVISRLLVATHRI